MVAFIDDTTWPVPHEAAPLTPCAALCASQALVDPLTHRQRTMMARAAGVDPRDNFKLHNIILAAPELNLQVATQGIFGDKIVLSTHRFLGCTVSQDQAISIAGKLFSPSLYPDPFFFGGYCISYKMH